MTRRLCSANLSLSENPEAYHGLGVVLNMQEFTNEAIASLKRPSP